MTAIIKELQNVEPDSKKYKSRFLSKLSDTYVFTLTDEIMFFHVGIAGTYFVTRNNKKYYINNNMKQLEDVLDPKIFFRINRSFIVHINGILKIIKFSNRRLKIVVVNATDMNMLVSRLKVTKFKDWIDS